MHDDHCTVSQNITNAIDDLSLLALRNIRVQPDEKFRFRDVVSEVIIRYSRHECRFIIWVECEHLLHVLLKGLYRDCNSWTSRIDLDQQIAQVVRELLAWHLIDQGPDHVAVSDMIVDVVSDLELDSISGIHTHVALQGSRDQHREGLGRTRLLIYIQVRVVEADVVGILVARLGDGWIIRHVLVRIEKLYRVIDAVRELADVSEILILRAFLNIVTVLDHVEVVSRDTESLHEQLLVILTGSHERDGISRTHKVQSAG